MLAAYEQLQRQFHSSLAAAPTRGLIASRGFRVPELPWLSGGGYEDWYLIDAYEGLGELAAGAVKPVHRSAHDAAARIAKPVAAGLFSLADGDGLHGLSVAATAVRWITRPSGVPMPNLEGLKVEPERGASLWQRSLVLGPTPELCLLCESGTTLDESHWKALEVRREAL